MQTETTQHCKLCCMRTLYIHCICAASTTPVTIYFISIIIMSKLHVSTIPTTSVILYKEMITISKLAVISYHHAERIPVFIYVYSEFKVTLKQIFYFYFIIFLVGKELFLVLCIIYVSVGAGWM